MADRDVEINLVGRNRLSAATRSAANDLDKLARKVDQLEKKLASSGGNIKIKADVDQKQISKLRSFGQRAGNAFSVAMASAINDGSRAIGNAIRRIALNNPVAQAGLLLAGARLAAFLGQGITAGLALVLGPALLAGPVAIMIAQMQKASAEAQKQEKKLATLKKQLRDTDNKERQAQLRRDIAAQEELIAGLRRQAAQLDQLKAKAKAFFAFISAPLRIPLRDALLEVGAGLGRLSKPLRDIMAALGPALAPFTKGIMNALVAFIRALQPALPGIVAGMQAWAREMPKIAQAFGDMMAGVLGNPQQVVGSVQAISGALQNLALGIGDLIQALTTLGGFLDGVSAKIQGFENNSTHINAFMQTLVDATYKAAVAVANATADALESLARWNPAFKGAAAAARTQANEISAKYEQVRIGWFRTANEINRKKIVAKLKVDKATAESNIKKWKRQLQDPNLTKERKAKINAKIAAAQRQIAIIKSQLAAIDRINVTANINIVTRRTNIRVDKRIGGGSPTLSSGSSFAALDGGSGHRTGGASPINVEAPVVSTQVLLDGRDIAASVRTIILDENKKAAYRARVGRRF